MYTTALELRKLLRQPEGPKLEFKQKFYAISSKSEQRQWGELIKDILSLANGNIGYAAQPGYLIIGPEDKLDVSGKRRLNSIEGANVNLSQIQNKVNNNCKPSVPGITLEQLEIDGCQLLIIMISPSPYLHELTRDILTEGIPYYVGAVLIRKGDMVRAASYDEMVAIKNEKDTTFNNLIRSDIDERINIAQQELNKRQNEYDRTRNKPDMDFRDHDRLYELSNSIYFQAILVDFLKTKKRMENKIYSNNKNSLDVGNIYFDYAIKLIKEKIPKIPSEDIRSVQLLKEIQEEARDKLDLAIENGCNKPSAYYNLIEIYDDGEEPLSAYDISKQSMEIKHEFVPLYQINIKIFHEVADKYEDYREEALDCIEIERNKLRKLLGVDVDEWGNSIDGKS